MSEYLKIYNNKKLYKAKYKKRINKSHSETIFRKYLLEERFFTKLRDWSKNKRTNNWKLSKEEKTK